MKKLTTLLLALLMIAGLFGCASSGEAQQLSSGTRGLLTAEEAADIALGHAGFSKDQVEYLHTEYEVDRGVPQYEVEFHQGQWEYDYEIHAETGEILSQSRED